MNATEVPPLDAVGREAIQGLIGSSEKTGQVIALIQDIADQTNLLALNATSEITGKAPEA